MSYYMIDLFNLNRFVDNNNNGGMIAIAICCLAKQFFGFRNFAELMFCVVLLIGF